ncbi:hypothetical protein KIPB_014192, partial [Kipferlia bialata]
NNREGERELIEVNVMSGLVNSLGSKGFISTLVSSVVAEDSALVEVASE